MILDLHTMLVAVAVATACCAIARIVLYILHPGLAGLGYWAWASVIGAASFAVAGTGAGMPEGWSLSLAHGLVVAGFCLVWDGFRRFLGRPGLTSRFYLGLGGAAVVMIVGSHLAGSLHLRATFNSALVMAISAAIARELLWRTPPHRLAMRLAGWVYFANALFFLVRGLSIGFDLEFMAGKMSYGMTVVASMWWLCVTISVTLCMVLMASERLQADLNEQASRDPLTGALNRRAFASLGEREIVRARRTASPLSLLMIDMDHFKQINDCLGHGGGDEVLVLFATLAGRILRAEDLFCRFGGEEFLALLPSSSLMEAMGVAERLRAAFSAEGAGLDSEGKLPFPMTLSVGIAALAADEDMEAAIRRADAALYRAKDLGRNRCELAGG
ncbi:GGDEF domain-containing protein [Paramagnetospirillum magneticum]|uniref:diguanylate cyclase n=1 Tax=Paramagnetospirillum magneticum (strain ATCC 700264 / AMB-1) TaxID=342108 RepID=Q2W491_PARM1|nr:GGDEF domain-containing protein [Paramagnetospirillum magneticum]BAE51334.1 FOG: GGDEF domain [Paramagnetospirillum magneticum AMB-1]